ncbi:hypothetical protein RhiirC2_800639, partial [Rhizophagus irregularis]
MKTLFRLTADSYINLLRFDRKLADTANYERILEHVLEDIAMKHKTCIHITSANKATRHEFISSVLHGVASCYDGEVKVCPKYELSGSHGKGPVDLIIKIRNTIIVITEAKKEDINQGVGQNAIQLQASSQRNKKKRTYNEVLCEDVMYGIISTGVDWVIIKLVTTGECNDNDNMNVKVLLSSRTPFTFPINESVFDKSLILEKLKNLFGKIKWVFDCQIELQESLKQIMSSKLKLLKQRITELEAKNVEIAELKKENAELRKENTDFRMKFANFEAERAKLKRKIAETLRMTEEERTRRDAENVKLKATIEELRKNNTKKSAEFRDRITKVEQNQSLNDNSSNN